MSHQTFTIRAIAPTDAEDLAHLVTIGARGYVPGDAGLVAEVGGAPLALISLTTGAVAADTRRAHVRAVKALRYRRYQVLRQGGDVGRARNVLRRLAPAPAIGRAA
jgi:hypothetical protein